jgi:hypothetical protein
MVKHMCCRKQGRKITAEYVTDDSKPDYSLLLLQSPTLSPLKKVEKTATCNLTYKSVHPSLAEKNYYYSDVKDEM